MSARSGLGWCSSCSSVGLAEPWTLPWELPWAAGSCGSLFWTFDLIKVSVSCAGFVDSSISCHLGRSCSPCAHSSAKGCSSALELTPPWARAGPMVEPRVVTAEEGLVLDLCCFDFSAF